MYARCAEQCRDARVQALADRLYRERYQYLLRIATRHAPNHADAEEAVTEAFLAFLQKFDPDSGAPPLAWLTLVAKREAWAKGKREHLDRRSAQEFDSDCDQPGVRIADIASEGPGADESIERAEHVLEARQRLAALKPDERRALLAIGAGYSYVEIGAGLGWTFTKTNRSAAEGRAALRAMAG